MAVEEEISKEELDNRRRLTEQALLLMSLYDLSYINREVYSNPDNGGVPYREFVCLEDDQPSVMMTRMLGVNMLNLSKLKSQHFSSLVPEMRFFKKTAQQSTAAGDDKIKLSEIVFPTHAGVDQGERYRTSLHESFSSLISMTPNMGVKSMDWTFQGATAHMEKSSLILKVQLYAERIADLFTTVVGQPDPDLKYSDLFTLSSKYQLSADSDEEKKRLNPDHFTLKLQVGWSIADKLASSYGPEAQEALKLLKEQKTLMDLSLVHFDFDFAQEGSVVVNLTYKSYLESMFNSPYHSNILFSKENLESQRKIRKRIKELEKKQKEEKDKLEEEGSSKDPPTTDEIIDAEKQKLSEEESNKALVYSGIIDDLLKSKRVRIYKVDEKNILHRYQNPLFDDMDSFKQTCSIINSATPISGFTFAGAVEIPSTIEEGSAKFGSPHLKVYLEDKDPSKKFYTYHEFDSSPALKGFIDGQLSNGLFSHQKMKEHALLLGFSGEPFQERAFSAFGEEIDSEVANAEEKSSACSKIATQNMSQEEINKASKKVVQATHKDRGEEDMDNLSEVLKEISNPEFDSSTGKYSIKYFFLGDLLEIAVGRLRETNKESWKNIRVVVGSSEFTTYSTEGQSEGFYETNLKNGVVEVTRTTAGDDTVAAMASITNKDYAQFSRTAKRYYRNLADIPISLNTFLSWFDKEYISKNKVKMPLTAFINGVMKMAIKSLSAIGDEYALLPKQDTMIQKTLFSIPREPTSGVDYFKFNNATGSPTEHRVLFDELRRGKNKQSSTKDQMTQDAGSNGKSLREAKLRGTVGNSDVTNYLILHSATRSLPPEHLMDFVKDSKTGIPHFFVGGSSGLMKSINFNLVENKLLESDAMLRDGDKFNEPRFPIKGRYDVELTLFGNTFFTPGSVICINPSALRLGNIFSKDSPINALKIAGYYNVVSVSSYIQNGVYETKVNARFLSPGNGFTADGRHMKKMPTRENLDKKKRKK